MASPNFWAAWAASGYSLSTYAFNWISGTAYFVDSTSAAALDSNAGTDPEQPLLTWTQAWTNVSAGDLIIVGSGHVETVASNNTLSKADVMTIGLGVGSTRPRFTSAVAAGAMWTPSSDGIRFANLYFPASTAATTSRISIAAGGTTCSIRDCYFECGASDTTNAVAIAGANAVVRGSQFVATASRPAKGINVTGAVSGVRLEDVLFDGASFGWSSSACTVSAAATKLYFENVRLANRSDLVVSASSTTYKMLGVRAIDSTGCRITIAA